MGVKLWATDNYVRYWRDMESSQVCPGKDFKSLFICLIWDGGLVSLECDVELDGLQGNPNLFGFCFKNQISFLLLCPSSFMHRVCSFSKSAKYSLCKVMKKNPN